MRDSRRGMVAGLVAAVAAVAVILGIAGTANAIPQSNPSFPTVTCGGTWHWVHNQLPAGTSGGTLTATFQDAGTLTAVGVPKGGGNTGTPATIHYDIALAAGDTLVSASDDISGGRLLLSTIPTCESTPPSSSAPPSSPESSPSS